MASKALQDILQERIPLKNILRWLSSEETVTDSCTEYEHPNCPKGEFVPYFLNFFRDQTSRVLNSSNAVGNVIKIHKHAPGGRNKIRSELFPSGEQKSSMQQKSSNSKRAVLQSSQDTLQHRSEGSTFCSTPKFQAATTFQPCSPVSPVCNSPHTQAIMLQKRFNSDRIHQPDVKTPGSSQLTLADYITKDNKKWQNSSRKRVNSFGSGRDLPNNECGPKERSKEFKTHKRRINPTKLNGLSCGGNIQVVPEQIAFGSVARDADPSGPFSEQQPVLHNSRDFEEERSLLRRERERQQQHSVTTPTKQSPLPPCTTVAVHEKVTYTRQLDILSALYCCALNTGLVLNLAAELCLIVRLLVIQRLHKRPVRVAKSPTVVRTGDSPLRGVGSLVSPSLSMQTSGHLSLNVSSPLSVKTADTFNLEKLTSSINSVEDSCINTSSEVETSIPEMRELPQEENKCTEKVLSLSAEVGSDLVSTSMQSDGSFNLEEISFFDSVHNCVYFAASVLNGQRGLLRYLDKKTLQLLSEHSRVATFCPELCDYLRHLYLTHEEPPPRCLRTSLPASHNVAFQSDTDNRQNFPNASSFHMFRKQRDGFYELLQLWEGGHNSRGWSFSAALGTRVRGLLGLHPDPANLGHLARLFSLQLLGTCLAPSPEEVDTELEDELLREVDPKKLSLLRERLTAPHKSASVSPVPTFPGRQEFYRDFILVGAHAAFNQHLANALLHQLMMLNYSLFSPSEMETTGPDSETRASFLACLTSTRLLAKFLGLIVFLPYQTSGPVSEDIIMAQAEVRSEVVPPVDLRKVLEDAVRCETLSLAVPWVVVFLAMMDPVTPHLPYYSSLFTLLFELYRDSLHSACSDQNLSALIINLSLGWLFGSPNFPEGLYYLWWLESGFVDKLAQMSGSVQTASSLDTLKLVDERCLYCCCPLLGELRLILAAEPPASNSNGTVRHITPVRATLAQSAQSAALQIQLQLEENFFHGHPASLRRTVEFVGERVASGCVRHLRGMVLPKLQRDMAVRARELLANRAGDLGDGDDVKEVLARELAVLADQSLSDLRSQCDTLVQPHCLNHCARALPPLLAPDVQSAITNVCVTIATRLAVQKAVAWIDKYFTSSFFLKELQGEVVRSARGSGRVGGGKTSHSVPPDGRGEGVEHQEEATPPPQAIAQLRNVMWLLLEEHGSQLEMCDVEKALQGVRDAAMAREDTTPAAEATLSVLSVDAALLLVTYRPDLVTSHLLDQLALLWRIPQLCAHDALCHLFSARNVMLLTQTRHEPRHVWECLGHLVSGLLARGLLSCREVEEQCLGLLRNSWPEPILRLLSSCIQVILKDCMAHNPQECSKFLLLMEWISESCQEMESFQELG